MNHIVLTGSFALLAWVTGCVVPGRVVMNEKGEIVGEEPSRLMFTPFAVVSPSVSVEAPMMVRTYPPAVYYPAPVYYPQPVYYPPVAYHRSYYVRPVRNVRAVYIGGRPHYRSSYRRR